MSETRLTRSSNDRMIAGVCGGLANYLEIDPVFVRLAFALLFFASGIGIPIYIILWIVMPEEDVQSASGNSQSHKTVNDIGESLQSGVKRLGKPGTVGVVLILLGAYFLLGEIGLFSWASGAILWPLAIVGLGVYLLLRRSS